MTGKKGERKNTKAKMTSTTKLLSLKDRVELTFLVITLSIPILFQALFNVFDKGPKGILVLLSIIGSFLLLFLPLYFFFLADKKEQNRKMKRKKIIILWIISFILTIASASCYFIIDKGQKIKSEDIFRKVFLESQFGNNIVIVAKEIRAGKEKIINLKDESELRYDILVKDKSNNWSIERIVEPNFKGYTTVRGLPEGEYKVLLMFYGIKLYSAEDIFINKRKGHYIELMTPKFKGCVKFRILDKNKKPISNAFVKIYAGRKYAAIRGSKTDGDGFSICTWLHSTPFPDDDYSMDIFYPGEKGKLIRSDYRFRLNFEYEWEEKKMEIVINQNK